MDPNVDKTRKMSVDDDTDGADKTMLRVMEALSDERIAKLLRNDRQNERNGR